MRPCLSQVTPKSNVEGQSQFIFSHLFTYCVDFEISGIARILSLPGHRTDGSVCTKCIIVWGHVPTEILGLFRAFSQDE